MGRNLDLKQDFECLRQSVVGAGFKDRTQLLRQFETLVDVMRRTGAPDEYTEDALDGVRIALRNLAMMLGRECILTFTIARLRYKAREAILAAEDEWRRQNS